MRLLIVDDEQFAVEGLTAANGKRMGLKRS